MKTTNKFLYILDNNNPSSKFKTSQSKYIAMVAEDSDGNEINNVDANQKIVVKNIKPLDELEPGLVSDINYKVDTSKLTVTWDALLIYIDDSQIKKQGITYNVYAQLGICSSGLTKVTQPINPVATSKLTADVLLSLMIKGPYCIVVTSKIDGKEYLYGQGTNYIYT